MDKSNFFSGFVEKQVVTKSGPVPIPLRVYDVDAIMAIFAVNTEDLRALLPSKLKPLSLFGKSILAISALEYKDNNIGPYNEIIVLVPVKYCGPLPPRSPKIFSSQRVGFHILIISVTTEIAMNAGIDIWGYPKFISKIDFAKQADRTTCSWQSEKNENIVSFTIRHSGIKTTNNRDLVHFSNRENQILKNVLHGRLPTRLSFGRNVEITFGTHPEGQKLARLIDNRKALFSGHVQGGIGALDVPEWGMDIS